MLFWLKTLWGIRHVRFWIHSVRYSLWVRRNGFVEMGYFFMNPADEEHFEKIWKGQA
jgi:hypothetical protein